MADEKNVFQKIGDAVVDFAPGIATVLAATGVGAPIAAAVGAVGALGRAFGLGSTASPADVLAAISKADPEAAIKIMVAENDFKIKMRDFELQELRAELGDIQSARSRQVAHETVTGKSDVNLYVLAWTIVVGFFGLMGLLFKYAVPADQTGVVFMLFGSLAAAFGAVIQYFFGSSSGSAAKTVMLSKAEPIK